MARIKRTPPINTKGRYTLISPFMANAGKTYTCMAIRSFPDVYEQGEDVFELYYEPFGLEQQVFDEDNEADANIITLMTDDGDIIYVPDTFIESYPMMGTIPYSHIVMSISLGALPDYLDLDFTAQQVLNVITDLVNPPSPVVNINKAPSVGFVSPADHEIAEAARVAGIQQRTTDYARVKELESIVDSQSQLIERLQQIILDNGYIAE